MGRQGLHGFLCRKQAAIRSSDEDSARQQAMQPHDTTPDLKQLPSTLWRSLVTIHTPHPLLSTRSTQSLPAWLRRPRPR